jgi:hypothetical protein
MKNWRTTISGLVTLVIGVGLAYVTVMIIPWGSFPPELPSELKTGLMSALMLGASGLITSGIQGITSRDNAESEKAVHRLEAQIGQVEHNAAQQAVQQVKPTVETVAARVAQDTAATVAERTVHREMGRNDG